MQTINTENAASDARYKFRLSRTSSLGTKLLLGDAGYSVHAVKSEKNGEHNTTPRSC